MLRATDITKKYGELTALSDVSVTVDEAEIVGVLGPNGAGKTTLFNTISGFVTPNEGEVVIGDKTITGVDPATICREGIVKTFQEGNIIESQTALNNILIGIIFGEKISLADEIKATFFDPVDEAARTEAYDILRMFDLEEKADVPADSLTLSEKKQLGAARAFASSPRVMLVDEIAAGLNDEEKTQILGHLTAINDQGVSLMVIEHDVDFIREISDRIILLNYGQKVYDGPPDELTEDAAVREIYLREEAQ